MTRVPLTALALVLPAASALAHGDHAPVAPNMHPLMHLAPGPAQDWLAIAAVGLAVGLAPWILGWLWTRLGRADSTR